MNFQTIKNNFDRGLWSAQMVATAVRKGVLSSEQYQEITGEEYGGGSSFVPTAELDAAYTEGVNSVE